MSDQYYPSNPQEKAYFDTLWATAHQSGNLNQDLSGAEAVAFFRMSNVDTGILRSIWSLCTPTGTMSNTQFYTAMRYIALCQAGEIPINAEKLRSTMRMTLALPKFANIPVPSLLPSPQPSAGQQQQQQGSSGGAPGGTYAITPEEHAKYHALFLQYDLNKDNYLESHEAAPIFAKSGLDNATLAAIWSMSDVDRDSRLSSKEFALAFHLIVCVGKKKLPLPPSLPPALISFLQNAPSVPMTTASLGPLSSPAKAPTQPQAAVPASPVMAFPSPLASSTFPSLSEPEPMNTNVSKATPRPASVSLMPTSGGGGGGGFLEDQIELENNVKSVTDVAKKSLASQERSVEASEKGSSGLKYLLQKLNAEKIALTSQLSSVEEDAAKASAKLNATVEEVKQLHSEVEELRAALAKKKESAGVFVSSEKAELEKRQLLSEISQLKEILDKDLQNHRAAALNVKEIATEQAAMNAAIDSHGEQAAQLQKDITAGKSELEILKTILANIQETREGVVASTGSLKTQSSALNMSTNSLRTQMKESEASVAALSKQKAEVDAEKASVTRQIASATSTPVAEIGPSSGSAKKEPEAAKSAAVTAKAAGDTDGGKSNNVSSSGSTGGTNEFPAASNVTANKGKENAVVPAAASSASDPFAEDPFPAPTNVLTTKKAEATNVASKGGAVKASGAANNQHDDFPTVDPSFASFDAFPAPEEGATKSLSAASAVDGFGHVDFPPTPSKNKRLVSEDGFPESEFPPPSDFSSFGDFSGSFHEESFTSGTKNAPW